MAKLADLLKVGSYDYLIPIDDLACELVFSDYGTLSSLTRVIGPKPCSYAVARNNVDTLTLAASIGLAGPVTQLVTQSEPLANPFFPCVVRPVVSFAIVDDEPQRFSVRKVNTPEALDAKLRDDLPRTDVLLQVPVSGAALGLNCCAIDGVVLGASATFRIHESPRDGVGTYRKILDMTPRLLAVIQAFARRLSWTGFMSITCKEEHGRLTFTKLTCRPSSAVALSLFAGVDFANLVLRGLEGVRPVGITLPARTVYMRDFRRDMRWLVHETTRAGRVGTVARWLPSFGRALIGRERFDIEQVTDPMPALRQFDGSLASLREKVLWRLSPVTQRKATAALTKSSSLLIVCQGNINRSVVTEHLFRSQGFKQVRSAGLLAMSGRRPSIYAERFLVERLGISLSTFRSKAVSRALKEIGDVDVVVCFERRQITELIRRFPDLSRKIRLLSELADPGKRGTDITDPHGGTPETYLACFQWIDELVAQVAVTVHDRPP